MRQTIAQRALVVLIVMVSAAAGGAWARSQAGAQPAVTLRGDGLVMVIKAATEAGGVSGDITYGENTYPFTGTRSRSGGVETVKGTFRVGGDSFEFETRRGDGDAKVAFTSGGRTYMLEPDRGAGGAGNPLAGGPKEAPGAAPAAPAGPAALLALSGDGLLVRVLKISDDQTSLSGELTLDGSTYPFTGRVSADEDDVETVKGTFRAGSESVEFSTSQNEDDEVVMFNTRGRTYRLRVTADVPRPAAGAEPAAARPGGGGGAGGMGGVVSGGGAGLPAEVRLRKVEFRDINMDNVVAYTMLVPDGWRTEGHIEWSNDKTPYPQRKIKVTGPDGSKISFVPAMTFHYAEATRQALEDSRAMGIPCPIPEKQGMAPPQDLGAWLVEMVAQANREISNVRLVSDQRDGAAEQAMAAQGTGGQGTWEVHTVRISYDMGGVPFTEEVSLTYARNPPMYTQNINMWDWMLFSNGAVAAPSAAFEGMKPVLTASMQSLRAVPRWWTQQQLLIMEITKNNYKVGMEEIRKRGQFYNQMSDDNYAAWKKSVAVGDGQQNDRINTIYEVQDFRDADGLGVKLPIHYQNYYSDGKGNYLMTNTTMVEPGSEWQRIEPVK